MDALQLKVNSRGSWANVLSFQPDQLGAVKAACVTLASAAGGQASFKIVDDRNVTRHALDARKEPVGWSDR